jgi:hypothetical protein
MTDTAIEGRKVTGEGKMHARVGLLSGLRMGQDSESPHFTALSQLPSA